jgi:hypothetical protein
LIDDVRAGVWTERIIEWHVYHTEHATSLLTDNPLENKT